MFELKGRLFTINVISDKKAQVVLKTTHKGKPILSVYEAFGFIKTRLDELRLQKNERVEGRWYTKGNLYKGKWYPDNCISEIRRYVKKPKYGYPIPTPATPKGSENKQIDLELGGIGNKFIIDEETGEILL